MLVVNLEKKWLNQLNKGTRYPLQADWEKKKANTFTRGHLYKTFLFALEGALPHVIKRELGMITQLIKKKEHPFVFCRYLSHSHSHKNFSSFQSY